MKTQIYTLFLFDGSVQNLILYMEPTKSWAELRIFLTFFFNLLFLGKFSYLLFLAFS